MSISGPNCVPCTRTIASLISLNADGTEQTPPSWQEVTTTFSECSIAIRGRKWHWKHREKLLNQRQCSNHARCAPGASGRRTKSPWTVWTSTRRSSTRPGIRRRTSSRWQLPTISFCFKRITNILFIFTIHIKRPRHSGESHPVILSSDKLASIWTI